MTSIKEYLRSLFQAVVIGLLAGIGARLAVFPIIGILHNRWVEIISSETVHFIYSWIGQIVGSVVFTICLYIKLRSFNWKRETSILMEIFSIMLLLGIGLFVGRQLNDYQGSMNKDTSLRMRETPLHVAIDEGQKEMAESLIAKGADVNAKTLSGFMPLQFAAGKGYRDIAELLIARGANVNQNDNMLSSSPLHVAAGEGQVEVAELLIAKGGDVNAKDIDGQTPLHLAADGGHLDIVRLLISSGSGVNAKDLEGKTALRLAAVKEYKDIATLLKEHGAQE